MATATETKQEWVHFISFLHDQRVVVDPKRPIHGTDPSGNVMLMGETPGKEAQFKDRKFKTQDPEIIEALRNDDRFNSRRGWHEDFDAARPSPADLLDAITAAAANRNRDELASLIEAEEESGDGGREDILRPARNALEALKSKPEGKGKAKQTKAAAEAEDAGSTDESEAGNGGSRNGDG